MSNALHVDDFLTPNKGNAAFSVKNKLEDFKQLYFTKISKDLLVSCTYNKRKDRWIFFFKFPSESNDKYPTPIMYDVMIEFDPTSKNDVNVASLNSYDIYIFSNSPSFIFTFDYVIKHKIGFPKALPGKYLSNIAISKPPKIRNTFEIMTAEKTTWICFFHLYRNGYLTKSVAEQLISKDKSKNEDFFIKQMETQPNKLHEIKLMNDLMKEAKKEEEKKKDPTKTYRPVKEDKLNPLSFSFTKSFKSGLHRYNPKQVLSHVSKKNLGSLGAKSMFKNDLKWNGKIK